MTQRRPEYTRPYSAEYAAACRCPVMRLMNAREEYVDAGYVSWLESELEKARKGNG